MKTTFSALKRPLYAAIAAAMVFAAAPASAHCDGLDGPVITSARQALDTNNVNRVLIWVQPKDEAEIKDAFRKAQSVRKLDPTAKEVADRFFFETLVRVHRAGEGAPYTGLKPAGRDLGPAIPAGDKAIASGSVEPVLKVLTHQVREGVGERYKEVQARKNFDPNDVQAGQQYVKAYVDYIHAVEKVHEAVAAGHGHGEVAAAPAKAKHQH